MDVSRITPQNIKEVSEKSRILFNSITIYFGPNSAEKNALLHALVNTRKITNRNILGEDLPDVSIDSDYLEDFLEKDDSKLRSSENMELRNK